MDVRFVRLFGKIRRPHTGYILTESSSPEAAITRPGVGAVEVILSFVGGDSGNPGLVVVTLIAVDVAVGGEEGFLRKVLRLVIVFDKLVADGEYQLFILGERTD